MSKTKELQLDAAVLDNLKRFYGIPEEMLQDHTAEYSLMPFLEESYRIIPPCQNDGEIIKTLLALTWIVRNHPDFKQNMAVETINTQFRRRDMLRLLILCRTTRLGDSIIIKNRSRSFVLLNDTNWFVSELMSPFIKKEGIDKISTEEAIIELEEAKTHHRGRKPRDPQMLSIIWGTFCFLSEKHGFPTPMPNALCNFIIRLLQLMDILPESTSIDAFWIRAQLRYMRAQKGGGGDSV